MNDFDEFLEFTKGYFNLSQEALDAYAVAIRNQFDGERIYVCKGFRKRNDEIYKKWEASESKGIKAANAIGREYGLMWRYVYNIIRTYKSNEKQGSIGD
jgi:hypothetical protein